MNNDKIISGVANVYGLIAGGTAAYYVNKALDNKTSEMVQECNSGFKAFALGVGHGAVVLMSAVAGYVAGATIVLSMVRK